MCRTVAAVAVDCDRPRHRQPSGQVREARTSGRTASAGGASGEARLTKRTDPDMKASNVVMPAKSGRTFDGETGAAGLEPATPGSRIRCGPRPIRGVGDGRDRKGGGRP